MTEIPIHKKSLHQSNYTDWNQENALQYSLWRVLNPQAGLSVSEANLFRENIEKRVFLTPACPSAGLHATAIAKSSAKTQSLLAKLNHRHFYHLKNEALSRRLEEVLVSVRAINHRGFNRQRATATLGAAAVFSHISARDFLQASGMWFGWKYLNNIDKTEMEDLLDHVLNLIRGSDPTETRIHATQIITDYLGPHPRLAALWRQISFSIIDNLHSWPLVVASNDRYSGGYCVPTRIDVEFDEKGTTKCIGMGELARFDWGIALNRARHVVNVFWGNQHNRLPDHKWRTEHASVTLDVSATTQMLRSAGESRSSVAEDILEGQLVGRSLEAHLVVGIMSAFMGRPASPRIAITGTIGEALPSNSIAADQSTQLPMNWQLGRVNGVAEKVGWAIRSADFQYAILPRENRPDALYSNSAENLDGMMHFSPHLLNVVDTAFGDRWRRERYVRTPDIAHLMHLASTEQINKIRNYNADEKADKALRWLQSQTSAVAWGRSEITPSEIALAFRKLNTSIREEATTAPYAKRSICFFRAVHEQGARLIAALTDELNVRAEDIRKLLLSRNAEVAADIFSDLVTDIEGGYGPRRVGFPDILVLLLPHQSASQTFDRNHLNADNFFSKKLAEKIQLKERRQYLSDAKKAWRAVVGKTRIIILEDNLDTSYCRTPDFSACEAAKYKWYARCLSELPLGFDQQQLRSVLTRGCNVDDERCEEIIEDLTNRNIIIQSFSGIFVNPHVRGMGQEYSELWKLNQVIASTIAPYVQDAFRSFDETAFSIRSIQDAETQLDRAEKRAVTRSQSGCAVDDLNSLRISLRQSRIVLNSFQPKSWPSLYYLSKSSGQFKTTSLIEDASSWADEFGYPEPYQRVGFFKLLVARLVEIKGASALKTEEAVEIRRRLADLFMGCKWQEMCDPEFVFVWSNIDRLILRHGDLVRENVFLSDEEHGKLRTRCTNIAANDKAATAYMIEKEWLKKIIEINVNKAGRRNALLSHGRRCFWHDAQFWERDLVRSVKRVPDTLWKDILHFSKATAPVKAKIKKHVHKYCACKSMRQRILWKLGQSGDPL